jgi:bacteriorhodopsin
MVLTCYFKFCCIVAHVFQTCFFSVDRGPVKLFVYHFLVVVVVVVVLAYFSRNAQYGAVVVFTRAEPSRSTFCFVVLVLV